MYQLLTGLNDKGVEYIVVGGIALALHGLVRATEDIDLFIRPTADNVSRLKQCLHSLWDDPAIDEISSGDLLGEYPAVRYGPPDDSLSIDILTRLGEAFHYDDLQSELLEVKGLPVRVATVDTLIRMKQDTVRLQDRADADALRRRFNREVH
jgi:diphthamide synthase (EF-2-diphthine--ammonia ligase)